jgi:hypothetical protein
MKCMHIHNGSVTLQVLFYCLAWLLYSSVELIFVFDGPMQPSVKHGHEVLKGTDQLTCGMQELLDVFRIPWYTVSI